MCSNDNCKCLKSCFGTFEFWPSTYEWQCGYCLHPCCFIVQYMDMTEWVTNWPDNARKNLHTGTFQHYSYTWPIWICMECFRLNGKIMPDWKLCHCSTLCIQISCHPQCWLLLANEHKMIMLEHFPWNEHMLCHYMNIYSLHSVINNTFPMVNVFVCDA